MWNQFRNVIDRVSRWDVNKLLVAVMVTVCLLKDETEEMLRQRRLRQIQHQQKVIR